MTLLESETSTTDVDREDYIKDFLLALDRVQTLGSIFQTIYEYHGGAGIGKSTLLGMLMKECDKKQVPYTFIDFSEKRNSNAMKYRRDISLLMEDLSFSFADGLLSDLRDTIEQYRHANADKKQRQLDDVARSFQKLIKRMTSDGPVVLFFDEAEKADQDDVIPWLEEWVINPLAQNGRCLFVWAGRRSQRWKRFEVRRRVRTQELGLFDKCDTEDLFEKNSVYPLGDFVIPSRTLTGGHPYADTIVLRYLDSMAQKGNKPKKENFDKVLPSLLGELARSFVYDFAFSGLESDVIQACEVMSLVRQFDIIMLRAILSEAKPDSFGKYDRNEFGSLLSKLRDTQLVLWDDRRKGYALDPTLRHIIGEHIRYKQSQLYAQVNRTAMEVYQDWIPRAGDNRGLYIVEELYQQACLNQVTDKFSSVERQELASLLQQRIIEYRQSDADLRSSALNRLYHELERDPDLLRLLDVKERDRLLEIVRDTRGQMSK